MLTPKYLPSPQISLNLYGHYPNLSHSHFSLGYCNWSFCLYLCPPAIHSPCLKSNFSKAWIDHATTLLKHFDYQLFKMTCKALHELVQLTFFFLSFTITFTTSVLLTHYMLPNGGAPTHGHVGHAWLLHIRLYTTSHISTLRRYFRFIIRYFLTFCHMATWLLYLSICVSESSSTVDSELENAISLSKNLFMTPQEILWETKPSGY